MHLSNLLHFHYFQKFCRKFILCAVLSSGIGIVIAEFAGDSYFLMMRMALKYPVSIVGSAVVIIIPYIVSFLLIIHSKPWLVYFICGIRIFLFSAAGFALERSFGQSAWLVRFLIQFLDIFLLPMLIWFSYLHLAGKSRRLMLLCCIFLIAINGMVYYSSISPFVANLIDSYETIGRYAIHAGFGRRL